MPAIDAKLNEVADYERRFRRAGLPLFIENYTATEDVFTRVVPILGLVFVAELALFVLLPALLPVIFGGQLRSAAVTAAGNALLLGLLYLVIGYGFLSTVRWGVLRLLSQLALSVATLARAVPLLLLFALVLFMTTEMWQVTSTVTSGVLVVTGASLVAVGTLFLIVELPAEVRALEREHSAQAPLSGRQRLNVGLLMFTSHALQVLVVSAAMGGFFVAFGAIAIRPEVLNSWIGTTGNELIAFDFLGERARITEELLRVSGAIAAFSGLYYAIAVLTDATYRAQFLDRINTELRDTFAQRARYLELVRR